jgi:hypothetical protein
MKGYNFVILILCTVILIGCNKSDEIIGKYVLEKPDSCDCDIYFEIEQHNSLNLYTDSDTLSGKWSMKEINEGYYTIIITLNNISQYCIYYKSATQPRFLIDSFSSFDL